MLDPKDSRIQKIVLIREESETEPQFLQRFMKQLLKFHKYAVRHIFKMYASTLLRYRNEYIRAKAAADLGPEMTSKRSEISGSGGKAPSEHESEASAHQGRWHVS